MEHAKTTVLEVSNLCTCIAYRYRCNVGMLSSLDNLCAIRLDSKHGFLFLVAESFQIKIL
jgi:hypothetical protein